MNKTIPVLLCSLLTALTVIPILPADDGFDRTFSVFLAGLVKRHDKLETLTMPNIEIHTVPGVDDEAVYILSFIKPADTKTFIAALGEEDVPYGTFPGNERQLMLFYQDIMKFIWMDILGL